MNQSNDLPDYRACAMVFDCHNRQMKAKVEEAQEAIIDLRALMAKYRVMQSAWIESSTIDMHNRLRKNWKNN